MSDENKESKPAKVEMARLRVNANHPLIRKAESEILSKHFIEAYEQFKIVGLENRHIQVRFSSIPNAGLGVFATQDLAVDDAIEFCHCVVLDWRRKYHRDRKIEQYSYSSSEEDEETKKHGRKVVLPMGYGMIYNSAPSASEANCEFHIMAEHRLMVFLAIKPIKTGEEILTWWGQGYYNAWCQPKNKTEEHNEDKKEQTK